MFVIYNKPFQGFESSTGEALTNWLAWKGGRDDENLAHRAEPVPDSRLVDASLGSF